MIARRGPVIAIVIQLLHPLVSTMCSMKFVFALILIFGLQSLPAATFGEPCGDESGASNVATDDVSPRVLLYRAICLRQFPRESTESVYGMLGQDWIDQKLRIGKKTSVYLSTGLSSDFRPWRSPSPDLIEAIDSPRVRSVNDAGEDDTIVIVENVDWVSANEVILDIGTYHKDLGVIHGMVGLNLVFKDGEWEIGFQGGCYTREGPPAE